MSDYPFKRSFYYMAKNSIEDNKAVFITGARKVGKTISMFQLRDELQNAEYIDMKSLDDDIKRAVKVKQIIKDIEDSRNVIHLIDEATYMLHPDASIASIALALNDNPNTKAKVVFTGSQSRSLKAWGYSAFGANAVFINADFLSYPEWLAYKHIEKPSAESYMDFICNTRDFYKDFTSAKEYLQSCLIETVNSNAKALEGIPNNDCDLISTDKLLDVLYSSMIILHNRAKYDTFVKRSLFEEIIKREYVEQYLEIGEETIKGRIAGFLAERYSNFKAMDATELHQALQFLSNCGLISLTYVSDNFDVKPYVVSDYLAHSERLDKKDVFQKLNVCINYPMFYVEMLKDVLAEKMPEKLNNSLLGSITECHIRGLLPAVGGFEYHDSNDKEIDYVNNSKALAIEISTSDKSIKDTHFDLLPDDYKKVLLTKSKIVPPSSKTQGIEKIPYYKFVFDNSVGRELVKSSDIPSGGASATGIIVTPSMYNKSGKGKGYCDD